MRIKPEILAVRKRIEDRSSGLRNKYLSELPAEVTPRTSVSCSNMAHTTAVFPEKEKKIISIHKAPHLGIVTAYNDMLSAHQPFQNYPIKIREAAQTVGATTQVAGGTPAMCDGITQGRPGMEISLFSRDVIAQATCVALTHDVFDAAILLGTCDKIIPGLLIGSLAFGHLPCAFIAAGPMGSGLSNQDKAKIRQLEAKGEVDRDTLLQAEQAAYHSSGTCTFYGTANSNQLLLDCMGLQWPGAAFEHPDSKARQFILEKSVEAITSATKNNKQLSIGRLVDAKCLVNALVGLMASGGSTNHTMHWVAIARAAGFIIDWNDMNDISKNTPLITRVYPNGDEDVNSFQQAGGTAFFIETLIDAGCIDGSAITFTGQPLAETVAEVVPEQNTFVLKKATESRNTNVLRPHDSPFQANGGIVLLQGNLGRGVAKVSAVAQEHQTIKAPCRVFTKQFDVVHAFEQGELNQDTVIVLIYQGPKANGMPELHKLTPCLANLQDQGYRVALLTDGRMSGASGKVLSAIHTTPEALAGGKLALLQDGDIIEINAQNGTLNTEADLNNRTATPYSKSANTLGRQYFINWRHIVSDAEQGACTLFENTLP